MVGFNRRTAFAAAMLQLLVLAMAGWARAATITVDTLSPTSVSGHCNLSDAIMAANTKAAVNDCTAGSGNDMIGFSVTGTITLTTTLPAIVNTLTITGPRITISGGGLVQVMFVNPGAVVTLRNLTIADGRTSGFGGGIFNNGTLTVTNSTFSANSAASVASLGGAIFNGRTLTVTNSTFLGNTAPSGGAGIANSGTLTVTNSTFSGNSIGGGVYSLGGSATLKGTILARSAELSSPNCGGISPTDVGFNISDDDSCGFTEAPSGTSIDNSTTLNLDPLGLQNNGGPTQTIALEPNSQAVDFIPVVSCKDQSTPTPLPLTTDQRGEPRPDPGNPNFCDAGAFELTTMPFAISGPKLQIARSSPPGSDQINLALTFTEFGFPMCDAGDDAFNGFFVQFQSGTCGSLGGSMLRFQLDSWVVHTIDDVTYGTEFASFPPGSLLARMVQLPRPAAPACGEWNLKLEISDVNSSPLGDGPFSLLLINGDGGEQCFNLTGVIVGSKIDPGRKVRRGVRR